MNIRLAENIKVFRKERKMTQEQLAEVLGVILVTHHLGVAMRERLTRIYCLT